MFKLQPFQFQALNFLKDNANLKGKALFIEAGLGKTIIATVFSHMFNFSRIVIVAPKRLHTGWQETINYTEEVIKLSGVIANNRPPFKLVSNAGGELVKTTLDPRTLLIIDEAHEFKNPKAIRSKNLCKLLDTYYPYTLLLTGTPAPKDYLDLLQLSVYIYNDLNTTRKSGSNIPTSKSITDKYVDKVLDTLNKWGGGTTYFWKHSFKDNMENELFNNLNQNCYFLSKAQVNSYTITKKENKVFYDLPQTSKKLIKKVITDKAIYNDEVQARATIMTIQQILDGFIKDADSSEIYDTPNLAKLTIVGELVTKIINKNEKIIIVTRFIHSTLIIKDYLLSRGIEPLIRTGELNKQQKDLINHQFKNNNHSVLIVTQDSTATGENYPACNNMVFYSRSTNYANAIQIYDRILRLNSLKNANFYVLEDKSGYQKGINDTIFKKVKNTQLLLNFQAN